MIRLTHNRLNIHLPNLQLVEENSHDPKFVCISFSTNKLFIFRYTIVKIKFYYHRTKHTLISSLLITHLYQTTNSSSPLLPPLKCESYSLNLSNAPFTIKHNWNTHLSFQYFTSHTHG